MPESGSAATAGGDAGVSARSAEVQVTLQSVTLPGMAPRVALKAHAVAVPALASHVRPALVLAERESRALLDEAEHHDVARGGRFATSPAGIQVWDRPWDGEGGTPGTAIHLGSVDWSYDTPVKHYVTIYRAMVTESGVGAAETTLSVLAAVLQLTGVAVDGARVTMASPPARDPFRRAVAI